MVQPMVEAEKATWFLSITCQIQLFSLVVFVWLSSETLSQQESNETDAKKNAVKTLEKAMASVRQAYADELRKLSKSVAVENWYSSLAGWPQPKDAWLVAEFPFDKPPRSTPLTTLANLARPDRPGMIEGSELSFVSDGNRKAVLLDGENPLVFPQTGIFSRTQEFTICLELKVPQQLDRAVVLHRTNSPIAGGVIGYELLIEKGRFSFGLIHKEPSNAIRIRCKDPVPVAKWMHVALVYGGTNSAKNTCIYIDGHRSEVDILQDSLQNDFLCQSADVLLTIGARMKDQGLVGGLVAQLQVYESALTGIEIAGLVTDTPLVTWGELSEQPRELWRDHYARREDAQCRYHVESFLHYFKSLSAIVDEPNPRNREK
jgi:Concanavalin A-like lectin/glucanases superfamily